MKPFIDSAELAEICGISQRQATGIIKEVQRELKEKGVHIIRRRPMIAPRREVFRKIGVEENETD